MALLVSGDRFKVFAAIMRTFSSNNELGTLSKADLQSAVDATDSWIDSNSASFNTALPISFRTTANLTQKTLLFCYVALKRAGLICPREE